LYTLYDKCRAKALGSGYVSLEGDTNDAVSNRLRITGEPGMDFEFDIENICAEVSAPVKAAGKDVGQILGTHRNWFSWLFEKLCGAPKSKQFVDKHGLFKTEPQTAKGAEITSGRDVSNDDENQVTL